MRQATFLFGVAAWIALSVPADAARLAADACEALKAEQDQLAQSGVRDDMQRGPEWAKANLPAARLGRIKRLIEVEEQVAFRCPHPRVAATPAPAAAAPDQPKPAVAAAPAEGEAVPPGPRRGKKKGHRAAAGPLPAPAATTEPPAQAPPAAEPDASGEAATTKAKKGRRAKPAADAQTAGGATATAPSADPKTAAPVKSQ